MTKKARLVCNPASGHEQMLQNVADVLDVLEQVGFEASTFRTMPEPLSAQNEAKRCALTGFNLLVGADGDGTINEIVNGTAPLEERPKLAVIPARITNGFTRVLKTPRDNLVDATKVILTGKTQKMGTGRTGKQYFINVTASGSLTELTYGVPSEVKSVLGYNAYLLRDTEMLPKVGSSKIRLTYDDGVCGGDLSIFLLGMTNSIGGFERTMPDAQLFDGLFQLIVVKTTDPVDVLRLMAMILSENHVNGPQIIYTKTKYLKIELLDNSKDKKPTPVNLGGEIGGHLPIDFGNLRQHVEFYAG